MAVVPVRIKKHGVFPREARARKAVPGGPSPIAADTVQWSHASDDWYVVFEGDSPFTSSSFHPASDTGFIDSDADRGTYKYTVYVEGRRIDPNIVID